MHTSPQDALDGQPWSISTVLRGLDLNIDDEGRPLSERRAPSAVKDGVPMVLTACPYHDERRGIAMNVSALAQITHHLEAVLDEIVGFRAASSQADSSWSDLLPAIVDQLAGPAFWLLRARGARGRVPAVRAVGHKLAAGFFGVLRSLVALEGSGVVHPVTVASFLRFLREQGSLIGASEACAGPPNMIERATRVLLHGGGRAGTRLEAERVELSQMLSTQVTTGIAWELFDRAESRALLFDVVGRDRMDARNPYMAGVLDAQVARLRAQGLLTAADIRFETLVPTAEPALLGLMQGAEVPATGSSCATIDELYAHGEGAVVLLDESHRAVVARRLVRYLGVLRAMHSALWRQEMAMREALDYPLDVPVQLESMVRPRSQSLSIFEAIIGHQLRCEIGPDPITILRNHRRSVTLQWHTV